MAPICRSTKPASTRAASARCMRARIFPCPAARARRSPRLTATKRTPTPRNSTPQSTRPRTRSEGMLFPDHASGLLTRDLLGKPLRTFPAHASCLLTRDLLGKPLRTFPDHALARLLVDPAPQYPHVADVGAEQHIERIACDRHRPGHALDRDIAEHPRRDVPGRAERARLAHQPQRDRRYDDIADHRDQSDNAVDAVADVGAGQDEGDVQKFCQRIEPRQPLLAGEIAERIGVCISEIEAEAVKLRPQRFRGDFASLLIDDRAARLRPTERCAGGFSGPRSAAGIDFVVRHRDHMVTTEAGASCVTPSRVPMLSLACRSPYAPATTRPSRGQTPPGPKG